MIDWTRTDELLRDIGRDHFCDVVSLFLEEADEVIGRLRTAPDPARLEADLHFLRGAALNLGFRSFGALCEAGERSAAAGDGGMVDLASLLASYEASARAFKPRAQEICCPVAGAA